mmetsp:Transcript_4660/g.13474  ORF Transcript_4660/g.13474 Transcript_4660/m.13474 type:complete len:312 (+) Transcript_4660:55-990(+)
MAKQRCPRPNPFPEDPVAVAKDATHASFNLCKRESSRIRCGFSPRSCRTEITNGRHEPFTLATKLASISPNTSSTWLLTGCSGNEATILASVSRASLYRCTPPAPAESTWSRSAAAWMANATRSAGTGRDGEHTSPDDCDGGDSAASTSVLPAAAPPPAPLGRAPSSTRPMVANAAESCSTASSSDSPTCVGGEAERLSTRSKSANIRRSKQPNNMEEPKHLCGHKPGSPASSLSSSSSHWKKPHCCPLGFAQARKRRPWLGPSLLQRRGGATLPHKQNLPSPSVPSGLAALASSSFRKRMCSKILKNSEM